MNVPMIAEAQAGEIMEAVIARGDLSQLKPDERARYYVKVCESVGLNPLTKPFDYIQLNGKLRLYALKDATDQLRKLNGVSIEVVRQSLDGELLTVHVRAIDRTGRHDEDFGVVTLGQLKGDARANAILKCVTKAKRRVTLSISGLGWLDETEVEDIPASAKDEPRQRAPRVFKKDHRETYKEIGRVLSEYDSPELIADYMRRVQYQIEAMPADWQAALIDYADRRQAWAESIDAGEDPDDFPSFAEDQEERWATQQSDRMLKAARTHKDGLEEMLDSPSPHDLRKEETQAGNTGAEVEGEKQTASSAPSIDSAVGTGTETPPKAPGLSIPHDSPGAPSLDDEPTLTEIAIEWDKKLAAAAKKGRARLTVECNLVPQEIKPLLSAALNRRHWPVAKAADEKKGVEK